MDIPWEAELADLLNRLAAAQQKLLALLARKHDHLLHRDHRGLAELMPEEEALCGELQACHERRRELLAQAEATGLPGDSIQSLAGALPAQRAKALQKPLHEVVERSRLLRHQSVAQWVVVQRTVLHLSQMLEIIATGGRPQPTYGNTSATAGGGALMDQAA
jgi:flagellar biosynthesis/type III secretory pathway chaperone